MPNHDNKKLRTLLLTLLLPLFLFGQDEQLRYEDAIYKDNIYTVRFYLSGLPLSRPLIDLRTSGGLTLSFDDLDGDIKRYAYTLIHCNADWKPSVLTELEYLDGFTENRINNFQLSYNTITRYTHYTLDVPNADVKITKSGNYILKVYQEDDKALVLTRRFVVVEPLMQIAPQIGTPVDVSKSNTHQEIDFIASYKGLNVRNPQVEVKALVMQNGRWDNAISDLRPVFSREEKLFFDYQDVVVFPAGKEFRWLDLRSFRYRTDKVQDIDEQKDGIDVTLFREPSRANRPYQFDKDMNGGFIIQNINEPGDNVNQELVSDYASVLFSVAANASLDDADVYVFGALSDWQPRPDCKMKYNEKRRSYEADILLKQGFYNYMFGVVRKGQQKVDLEEMEGNWYETENDYTIILYYRPFGERFDRVVGAYTFNSIRRK